MAIEWLLVDASVLNSGSGLVPYKVRTTDTIKSLGERFGCRWQDIALLNWGTDRPTVINWYLEHQVGCSRNSAGYFFFHDDNEPGIIYLPEALVAKQKRVSRGSLRVSRYPIGGA